MQACLDFIKPFLALYIGGMGARGKNFYNDLACRYGFEAAAKKIQDLYLDGKKDEAAAAVPDELADEVSLGRPDGAHPRSPRRLARVRRHDDDLRAPADRGGARVAEAVL